MRQLYFLFTIAFVIAIQSVSAQYITPGTNLSLSLDQLVSSSGGVVTFDNGTYYINNTLTISATDTLRINSAATIRVAATKRIEVSGTIISNPTSGTVFITAIDTSTVANNFKGFRFDNSQGNIFKNTTITHGGGQQLIASSAIFEYCTFRRNGSSNVSAVITYSGCSPIIKYCSFIENARSAVGSGANVSGSPHILYNYLYRNTTDNSNRPQINIGPGSNDTIYIVGNYIEGFYDNAGGIGLSNLLSTGSTKAVVKDNTIIGNRYGYAQIGNSISALITDNIILDNDIQNNPNLGGSGLNFQASGSGNTAIVRRNIISGSLWGITIQSVAQPDFGTTDNPGNNVIYENGNGGVTYALYNNTVLPINAVGNYWGTNDPIEAENYIFHQPDQASLGLVTYLPINTLEPVIQSFGFLAADNAGLSADVFGTINQTNKTINVVLPAGTAVNALIPEIGLALGVTTIPGGGVITDFTQPVTFEVKTPHGLNENYVVTVSVEVATFSATFQISNTSSQTITDAIIQLNGTTYPAGTYFFDNLSPGTYDYTVSHPNYQSANGNFSITDQNVVVPVTIVPLSYTVTFDIKNTAGTAITNAI
ncbi:MAG: hypothetical protein Q8T08_26350, partial [Ignavibacteria bacterium]|nr:hypothetical protein [Ignavibacteria bacterium]